MKLLGKKQIIKPYIFYPFSRNTKIVENETNSNNKVFGKKCIHPHLKPPPP